MVRDWKETLGGKRPASIHAPNCEDYKLEAFAIVHFDDIQVVMELNEARAMDGKYEVKEVQMTRDQFERLGEF